MFPLLVFSVDRRFALRSVFLETVSLKITRCLFQGETRAILLFVVSPVLKFAYVVDVLSRFTLSALMQVSWKSLQF